MDLNSGSNARRSNVTSTSSENRAIASKTLDKEVPPWNAKGGTFDMLTSFSSVQHTQTSFSKIFGLLPKS